MPFIFLLLFALVCMQGTQWPERPYWLTDQGCAMLVGTLVLASWLSAGLIGKVLSWQMQRQPQRRSTFLRRYSRWRRYHFIALLTAYFGALYGLGWGQVLLRFMNEWIPPAYRPEGIPPGFQLTLLAPLFAGLLASWERFYQVEKTAYEQLNDDDRYVNRLSYLLMQVRHQFFIVLPPIFVMTLLQIMYLFFGGDDKDSYVPIFLMLGIIVTALLTMPIVLRLFLGLKPLPAGPLRERLECTARRLGFRYSNILVWHTRNLFANAMVTGFIPWIRYIVLTDRLIEELTPDEIEAVFGHEVGHIKHHHLLFYLVFFVTSVLILGLIWELAGGWLTPEDISAILPSEAIETLDVFSSFGKLGILAGYMLVFFGFLSRRCERQADLYGAQTVSTEVFISALEKVADINGMSRNRFSWLHPSIDKRIAFLQEMRDQPARVPGFHLSLRLMQLGLYLVLGELMLLLWTFNLLDVGKLLMEF